jgi:fibronectin type 3 domain-containing protein
VTPASKPTARKTKVARKITWNKNLTVKKYKIYRATKKNGKYQLIGTSSKQSYIDRNTSTKKTYYYKVAASNKYLKCDSKKSTAAKSKNIN